MTKVTSKIIENASDNGIIGRIKTYLKPNGLECKEIKTGQFDAYKPFKGETWRYEINVEA